MRGSKRQRSTGGDLDRNISTPTAQETLPTNSPARKVPSIVAFTPGQYNIQSPQESLSGDASARGFLTRVYGHLSAAGHAMPRYLSRPADRRLPDGNADPTIILPSRETTLLYLDCFAEHAQATYRYVPRKQWMSLVTRLYDDDELLLSDDANMALLLLVIGLG
jgi:hypothetical protein